MGKKILIIGAGGVGGIVGKTLEEHGKEVYIYQRQGDKDITHIKDQGVPYTPKFLYIKDSVKSELFDLIIISTKAVDIEIAMITAKQFISDTGKIVVIQNGIDHLQYIPDPKVYPAIVYLTSSRVQEDGSIYINKVSTFFKLHIQNFEGFEDINTEISDMEYIKTEESESIEKRIWEKMIHISVYSGMVSAYNQAIGDVRNLREYMKLLDEVIIVCEKMSGGKIGDASDIKTKTMNQIQKTKSDVYPSFWYDLQKIQSNASTVGKHEYYSLLGKIYMYVKENNVEKEFSTIMSIHNKIIKNYSFLEQPSNT